MTIRTFILPADRRAVVQNLGGLLVLFAALLVVPAGVALITGEPPLAGRFAGIGVAAFALGWLARRGDPRSLGRREALIITALAYPMFAVLGAIAFLGVAGPVDALFESMSGFTTTGLTVLDEESVPPGLLFFRSYSQWIGGAGVVVLSLVVLSQTGSTAARLYTSESGQENLLGSVLATARMVAAVYVALTAVAYVALLAAGAGGFDGLLHALALTSTGGFSPFPDSIAAYDAPAVTAVTGAFMVLGATSIPLYWLVWRGGWRRLVADRQLLALLLLAAAGAGASLAFLADPRESGQAVFHAVSALTTTGFVVGDPAEWPEGMQLTTMVLMVVGGSVGSTAGGIKLLRLLVILTMVRWTVVRLLLPRDAKVPVKLGGEPIDPDELRLAWTLVAAYMVVVVASTVALSAAGHALDVTLFDSISALSTVGLTAGLTSPELPSWAKLVLTFNMWVGRVEIVPVLILVHPANWHGGKGAT